jgi:hypothetical protein
MTSSTLKACRPRRKHPHDSGGTTATLCLASLPHPVHFLFSAAVPGRNPAERRPGKGRYCPVLCMLSLSQTRNYTFYALGKKYDTLSSSSTHIFIDYYTNGYPQTE